MQDSAICYLIFITGGLREFSPGGYSAQLKEIRLLALARAKKKTHYNWLANQDVLSLASEDARSRRVLLEEQQHALEQIDG